MSDFFTANFIGSPGQLLSTYTPNVGSPVVASEGGNPILTGRGTIQIGTAVGISLLSGNPPGADYAIQVDAHFFTVVNDQAVQLYLRYVPGTGARISFIYDGTQVPPVIYIADQSTGFAVIAGPINWTPTAGNTYTFLFQVSGTTYTFFRDGVSIMSGTSTSLPATQHAAFLLNGVGTSSTGVELGKLRAFPTGSPSAAIQIAPNDSRVLYDPVGWNVTGGRALSVNPGSHMRVNFSGSSYIRAYFDTTNYGGDTMNLAWRLGTGVWATGTLAVGTDHIDFGTGLSGVQMELVIQITSMPQTDPFSANPVDAIRITNYEVDIFGAFQAITDTLPKRAISFGDSITRQSHAGPGDTDDSRYTYPSSLWYGFNAEWSNVSFGGQGWLNPGIGMTQAFFVPGNDSLSTWNKTIVGTARVFTSIDYITAFLGTNDGGFTALQVANAVTGWLVAIRAACPAAKLFIIVPFYASSTGVTNGYNTYQTGAHDANAFLVSLGTNGSLGITEYPTPTWYSPDGLHMNTLKQAQFSSMVSQSMQGQLGGIGGGGINGSSILGII
jgi:lysophospholipase L1-like esterase